MKVAIACCQSGVIVLWGRILYFKANQLHPQILTTDSGLNYSLMTEKSRSQTRRHRGGCKLNESGPTPTSVDVLEVVPQWFDTSLRVLRSHKECQSFSSSHGQSFVHSFLLDHASKNTSSTFFLPPHQSTRMLVSLVYDMSLCNCLSVTSLQSPPCTKNTPFVLQCEHSALYGVQQ